MKVYEFGAENKKTMLMSQCSAEPSWIMFASAEAMRFLEGEPCES